MSGESVTIEYHGKFEIEHIDALNNMICKNKIDKYHVDLCLQFLYELGFFYPTSVGNDHLTLRLPNQSAHSFYSEICKNGTPSSIEILITTTLIVLSCVYKYIFKNTE